MVIWPDLFSARVNFDKFNIYLTLVLLKHPHKHKNGKLYVRTNPMDHHKAYEDKLGDNLFYSEVFHIENFKSVSARFSIFALSSSSRLFTGGGKNHEQLRIKYKLFFVFNFP